jgi:transmembrane sensor
MTARSDMDERLLEEAMAWHVALESDDADWDGYTLWLEADPRHREAFDVVALTDRLVGEHRDDLRLLTAAPPPQVRRGGRRQMLFGGVAAALALAIGIPALMPKGDTVYATGAGETRRIALGNGAAIDLAPASRLVVKEGDENDLELAGGEAYFDVRHDPARALTIHAQGYAVSDIGTRFAMNLAGPALLVSVAEGHVAVGSEGNSPTDLAAGQKLVARGDEGTMRISRIAANDVGSWRQGRLVYDDAPLSVVAADIARYSGKAVVLDPAIRARRFSGVLSVGDGSKLLADLAAVMALRYDVQGDRIRVSAGASR